MMRPALLHLDEALAAQPGLVEAVGDAGGWDLDVRALGPALRLWTRPKPWEDLRAALRQVPRMDRAPELVFAGSGDFHHVTPLLVARVLETTPGPLTIIHFDNHPDWVIFDNGVHCGSWVGRAARLPGIAKVISIGICSDDIENAGRKGADLALIRDDRMEIYPYRAKAGATVELGGATWPTIESLGEPAFFKLLNTRIWTDNVYVTIDKDVLRADDAATNWDQGICSLDFLIQALREIGARRRILGADVVGDYSAPRYAGVMASLWKRGEALMDQPFFAPSAASIKSNEAVNLTLLRQFAEAMS